MHKNNFNLIRLLLSIMVVYSHSFGLLNLKEPTIFNRTFGNFAVHCFFALSGYLIATSFLNSKSTLDFLYKRTLRIAPAFFIALIVGHLLNKIFNGYIENPVPYIVNGTVWTLSWEIFCYVICCLIGYIGLLKPISVGTLWLIVWVLIVSNIGNQTMTFQVIVPMLFLFLSGMFVAVNEKPFQLKYTGPIYFGILLLILVQPNAIFKVINLLPWLYSPQYSSIILNFIIYLFCLPLAIIYIGKYISVTLSIKDDISYGIYIYTWPIQQTTIFVIQQLGLQLSPLIVFASSLIISIILSFISWRIIEKPVNSLKRINLIDILQNIKIFKKRDYSKDSMPL